jgi:hypothetical protein
MNGIAHGLNERGTIVSGFLLNPGRSAARFVFSILRFLVSATRTDRVVVKSRLGDRFFAITQTTDRNR